MAAARLKALAQTVARHPWSSLQDLLLVAMAMLVATLLALQYNLFFFIAELSDPQPEDIACRSDPSDLPAGTLHRRVYPSSAI